MRQSRSASAPTSPAETITKAIIERLEAGVRPWRQPWTGGSVSRPLRVCGTPYRGINVIWLWMDAHEMLDVVPVRWQVVRQVRPKYSCRRCEKIVQAPAPVSAVARQHFRETMAAGYGCKKPASQLQTVAVS